MLSYSHLAKFCVFLSIPAFSVNRLGDLLQFGHLLNARVFGWPKLLDNFLGCLSFSSENCFGSFRWLFVDVGRLLLKPSGHPACISIPTCDFLKLLMYDSRVVASKNMYTPIVALNTIIDRKWRVPSFILRY